MIVTLLWGLAFLKIASIEMHFAAEQQPGG
jgi:hypothetical protein